MNSKTMCQISRENSGTTPGGMNTISFQQVRSAPKTRPIVYKTYVVLRHHLDIHHLMMTVCYESHHCRATEHITVSDIVLASSHTSLTLFLVISDWRSRISLASAWITILLNLRVALASILNLPRCQALWLPVNNGKQWTMVAGVSIFTFRTIESPITRALSPGFSVGASLSGENLFDRNGNEYFKIFS